MKTITKKQQREIDKLTDIGHKYHCAYCMVLYNRPCGCNHDYIYRPNATPRELAEKRAREAEDRLNKEHQEDIYGVEDSIPFIRKIRIT